MTTISPLTQTLYKGLGFVDKNENDHIEKGKNEGYEKHPECDLAQNGKKKDGKITTAEAWNRYFNNLSLYPEVTKTLNQESDFVDPFQPNKGLIDYTQKVISGAKTDKEKAFKIFFAILGKGKMHINSENEIELLNVIYDDDPYKRPQGIKSSIRVFKEKNEKGIRFATCMEDSSLFYTMCKIAKVQVHFADVEIDFRGRKMTGDLGHICNFVILDGEEVFVDLAYKMFGVKHQKTTPLDEATALAHFMNTNGTVFTKQGKLDLAFKELKRALEITPDFPDAHSNLGVVYCLQGKYDLAIAEHKRALEIEPDNPDAHTNLGITYQKKGKLSRAIKEHKKAIALDSNHAKAHLNLGNAYNEKGKLKLAIEEYKKVIALDPTYANHLFLLGNNLLQLKNEELINKILEQSK